MANPHRGEVELVIGGKSYTVRGTMSAIAEICDALGVDSMKDFGTRLLEFRPRDMLPMARALLKANGHEVSIEELDAAMGLDACGALAHVMVDLFFDKPKPEKEGEARPPKRQKAAA